MHAEGVWATVLEGEGRKPGMAQRRGALGVRKMGGCAEGEHSSFG